MISGPIISADEAIPLFREAVIVDARAGSGARAAHLDGHADGALFVDLDTELSDVGDPCFGGRHPLPSLDRWRKRIGAWGITPSTPVLIYDAANSGMAAARAWWMFDALGHQPLAVVDGGWAALHGAGAPAARGGGRPAASGASYPATISRWPVVNADFVDRARRDAAWRVLDARAPERYAGESEPIDPVAGHIAGAQNLYWQTQVDDDGTLIDQALLRERYAEALGEVTPERVICYCGSGVTACHLLLGMAACGLRGAQLYVGSWSEWCRTREGAIGVG